MRSNLLGLMAVSVISATALPAVAGDPFSLTLTVDGQTTTASYRSVEHLVDVLETDGINSLAPHYTDRSVVSASINARGLAGFVTMNPAEQTYRISIPAAGVDRTFTGATNDVAAEAAKDYFKSPEGHRDVQKVLRTVVATTTSDPVAGSPSSLLGQMITADHQAGISPLGDVPGLGSRAGGWRFGVGASRLGGSVGGFETSQWQIPLSSSYTFGTDGIELFSDAPLTIAETEGGQSYFGSIGVGLRIPVIRNEQVRWTLTPAVRAGAAGSIDLGSAGVLYGASVASDLRYALTSGYTLNVGNSISHYKSMPLSAEGYEVDYGLSTTAFRNGISVTKGVGEVAGRALAVSASFVDTRLTGTKVAVSNWQEYGVAVTVGTTSPTRIFATYLNGEHGYRGFRAGVGLSF